MNNKPDFSGVSSSVDTTAQVVSQTSQTSPPAPAQTHTVAKGDTLSAIARHYLGKATDWPKIFEANRDQLNDPDRIQIGQVLKIPSKHD